MKLKRHHQEVPELSMAAMPDLIFTVLFFFMIVTHMRVNTVQIQYQQPTGENLVKVTNKSAVINIYVGKAIGGGDYEVQVGDEIVPLVSLTQALRDARAAIPGDQMDKMCASLLADKEVPMSYINKVKLALREAKILKINYNGLEQNNETIPNTTQQDSN